VSVASFTEIVRAISSLLNSVLWPLVVVFVVCRLLPDIRRILTRGGFNFRAPGVELSVERASEAAAALGAASTGKGELPSSPSEVAAAISRASESRDSLSSAQILWVDDHPENNVYERQALSALGVRFSLARSTKKALEMLRTQHFQLIISDLGRQSEDEDDTDAGLTLLGEIQKRGIHIPYLIYAGRRAAIDAERIKAAGATASIYSPTILLGTVADLLSR